MPKKKSRKGQMMMKRRQMRKMKNKMIPDDMDMSDKAVMVRGY